MLAVLNEIFLTANKQNIRYLHWKSNEHVEAGLEGDTDLDIIVHPNDMKKFVHLIENQGFSLYQSVGKQNYISIFDYILLDANAAKMLHIHLHINFIVGRTFYKQYLIPLEEIFFENAIIHDAYPIKTMDPSQELVILWLRYCMKTSIFKFIRKRGKIGSDYIRESNWLMGRVEKDKIEKYIDHFLLTKRKNIQGRFIEYIYSEKKFFQTIIIILKIKKNYSNFKTEKLTSIKYFFVRCKMVFNYILQNKFNQPVPYRRVNLAGGKIIAFIGSDGAGKSTVIDSVRKTLIQKIDIHYEYLGSGDGKSSLLRAPMQFVHNVIKKTKKGKRGSSLNKSEKVSIIKLIWAIALAKEKKKKLQRIWKAKARGMIVICDRYPQIEVTGINDGVLLYPWLNKKSLLKKSLANWEYSIYKLAVDMKPDVLIKMLVDKDTAMKRKPDDEPAMIEQKVDIIKNISIPAKQEAVIDANKKLDIVLNDVYSKISEII